MTNVRCRCGAKGRMWCCTASGPSTSSGYEGEPFFFCASVAGDSAGNVRGHVHGDDQGSGCGEESGAECGGGAILEPEGCDNACGQGGRCHGRKREGRPPGG